MPAIDRRHGADHVLDRHAQLRIAQQQRFQALRAKLASERFAAQLLAEHVPPSIALVEVADTLLTAANRALSNADEVVEYLSTRTRS